MPRRSRHLSGTLLVIAAALGCVGAAAPRPAAAQTGVAQQSVPTPPATSAQPMCPPVRTALVLAGGGAKGAAHVGVIKVLDSLGIHPDLVVGTSIGSIVGALYASGYTGNEIDSLSTAYPIGSLFQSYRPRLPSLIGVGLRPFTVWESWGDQLMLQNGSLNEQDVVSLMNAMMLRGNLLARGNFDSLPIPYRAIATDLATRGLVIMDKGDLTQAVRASFAIPLVFTPVRKDGRLLIDGGIALNVPISVARQLGAERVIVSRLDNSSQAPKSTGSTLGTASLLIDYLFRQPIDSLLPTDVMVSTQTGQFAALDFAPARIASLVQLGHDRAVEVFRNASCMPPATPAPTIAPIPPLVGMIIPSSTVVEDALPEVLTLRIETQGPLHPDTLRRGLQRTSYSDPFQGAWLNPVPEDSQHVGFRPAFIDRPERSIGIGIDYVTSLGAHLWTGVIDRRLGTTHVEGTALLEMSEIRQELSVGVRRTTRIRKFTTHPIARVTAAREQVRFFGSDHEQLAGQEVDEGRLLLGFERALAWGGRYRWGLESHLWKQRDSAMVNAIGVHGQFWWLRPNGSPRVTVEADVNSRYERVLFTANTVRHPWKRVTFIPSLRFGFGSNLPAQETFSLGGFNGFPGFKVFEARGTVENATSLLLKYHLTGPISLTTESVGGAIFDADTLRGKRTNLPADHFVDGNRYGIEIETPLGPVRMDVGHNTTGRQQATISIGSWR